MSRMSNVREILCKERVTKKVKSENDQFSNRVAGILLKEIARSSVRSKIQLRYRAFFTCLQEIQ